MTLKQIGVVHSPHKQASGTPAQASMAQGTEGTVEVFPEFAPGLKDLDVFDVKRCGWLDGPGMGLRIADGRFEKPCG